MTQMDTPIGVAEAAEILGRGRTWVLNLIASGRLPAHKLAGRTGAYVMRRSDVEQLAERAS